MFGVITADIQSLSKKAQRRYKQYYCGLCHALQKNYGALARFVLSFDTAFLLTVLDSLNKNDCNGICRCPYHFFKKRNCNVSTLADYAADVTILLTYLNAKDDIADGGSLKAVLFTKLFKNKFEKAKSRQPKLCSDIEKCLAKLFDAENRNENNPDIPANIFGHLLGLVFTEKCYEFGYHLGRFIYLYDAVCDFKGDLKNCRYNPLVSMTKSEFLPMLETVMGDCVKAYDSLNITKNCDIIENVLYSGVWIKLRLKGYKND